MCLWHKFIILNHRANHVKIIKPPRVTEAAKSWKQSERWSIFASRFSHPRRRTKRTFHTATSYCFQWTRKEDKRSGCKIEESPCVDMCIQHILKSNRSVRDHRIYKYMWYIFWEVAIYIYIYLLQLQFWMQVSRRSSKMLRKLRRYRKSSWHHGQFEWELPSNDGLMGVDNDIDMTRVSVSINYCGSKSGWQSIGKVCRSHV